MKKLNKTKQLKKERNRLHKEWRIKVLERDGHKCVLCGDIKRVNVHHIISRSVKSLSIDEKNGICVCALHHIFDRKISAHKGSLMFITWLIKNRRKQYNYLIKKLGV